MSLADWWSRMTAAECSECGEPVSAFARACRYCGARNPSRAGAIAIAAALAVLLIAIGVAAFVVLGWRQLPVEAVQDAPAVPGPVASPSAGDFAWLTNAMQECDAEAAKQQGTLYFLVIPLASKPEDAAQWRSRSLNLIGNAILLSSDAALDGLRQQALQISTENYVFNARDQASAIYNWKSSTGVARLSIPDADSIASFNIQFQTQTRTSDSEWGNVFVRRKGTCYWVNAIIGN